MLLFLIVRSDQEKQKNLCALGVLAVQYFFPVTSLLPSEIHDSEERSGFNRGGSNTYLTGCDPDHGILHPASCIKHST